MKGSGEWRQQQVPAGGPGGEAAPELLHVRAASCCRGCCSSSGPRGEGCGIGAGQPSSPPAAEGVAKGWPRPPLFFTSKKHGASSEYQPSLSSRWKVVTSPFCAYFLESFEAKKAGEGAQIGSPSPSALPSAFDFEGPPFGIFAAAA